MLLMIPGGAGDAGIFAGLTPFLTDRYTAMPYDPRGNSRSVPDDPTADQDLDVHGDDAAALLAAVTDQPAYVLGNSGGAQIAVDDCRPRRGGQPGRDAALLDRAAWDADGVRDDLRGHVVEQLGNPNAVVDETDDRKKGPATIGNAAAGAPQVTQRGGRGIAAHAVAWPLGRLGVGSSGWLGSW